MAFQTRAFILIKDAGYFSLEISEAKPLNDLKCSLGKGALPSLPVWGLERPLRSYSEGEGSECSFLGQLTV